jgi:carnitine-CoA ligase
VRVVDCYGMTEAEPITVPVDHGPARSHGLPSDDFEVAIIDEHDFPVEVDAVGEIVCRPRRPDVMFCGYEGDAEKTVEAWRNLWFHTGDLGYLGSEGHLFFVGRRKFGIRHLGENVSAWELEQLVATCPGVASAVAVGVPVGEGEDDVKVVVVQEAGADLTPDALHAWCRQNMAKFMVPRYVEFLEELPTFGIGKIDRAALTGVDAAVWDAQLRAPKAS